MKSAKNNLTTISHNNIPQGWTIVPLSTCLIEKKENSKPPHKKIPYIGLEHIESGNIRLNGFSRSDKVLSNCSKFKIGDILYGKLRPKLNKAIIAPFDGICSTEIVVLNSTDYSLNQFLIYHLHTPQFIDYNVSHSFGTKMPRTSIKTIIRYLITLPPLSEQQAIAAILSAIDDAISTTVSIITQTESLKQGLMQQLLTRGIDENGVIRSLETHKFKDTSLGRIPYEYKIFRLSDISQIIRGASPRPKGDPRYYGGSVPRLMVEDLTRDGIFVSPKIDSLTVEGARLSRLLPKGSLVLVCSGTPQAVGLPAILSVDSCIHDGFLGIVNINEQLIVEYYSR